MAKYNWGIKHPVTTNQPYEDFDLGVVVDAINQMRLLLTQKMGKNMPPLTKISFGIEKGQPIRVQTILNLRARLEELNAAAYPSGYMVHYTTHKSGNDDVHDSAHFDSHNSTYEASHLDTLYSSNDAAKYDGNDTSDKLSVNTSVEATHNNSHVYGRNTTDNGDDYYSARSSERTSNNTNYHTSVKVPINAARYLTNDGSQKQSVLLHCPVYDHARAMTVNNGLTI